MGALTSTASKPIGPVPTLNDLVGEWYQVFGTAPVSCSVIYLTLTEPVDQTGRRLFVRECVVERRDRYGVVHPETDKQVVYATDTDRDMFVTTDAKLQRRAYQVLYADTMHRIVVVEVRDANASVVTVWSRNAFIPYEAYGGLLRFLKRSGLDVGAVAANTECYTDSRSYAPAY